MLRKWRFKHGYPLYRGPRILLYLLLVSYSAVMVPCLLSFARGEMPSALAGFFGLISLVGAVVTLFVLFTGLRPPLGMTPRAPRAKENLSLKITLGKGLELYGMEARPAYATLPLLAMMFFLCCCAPVVTLLAR